MTSNSSIGSRKGGKCGEKDNEFSAINNEVWGVCRKTTQVGSVEYNPGVQGGAISDGEKGTWR